MLGRANRVSPQAFTLLELLVVLAILGISLGMVSSAVQQVRGAALRSQCLNQLRQQGIALHLYHGSRQHLPAGVLPDVANEPLPFLTWQAQILPFLEQEQLWRQTVEAYRQDRNFLRSPPHLGMGLPLSVCSCPADPRSSQPQRVGGLTVALTSYQGVNGTRAFYQDGVLFPNSRVRFDEISDGLSQTLLVGERPASADLRLGWWYAGTGQDLNGECDSLLGTRTKNTGTFAPDCQVGPYDFQPGRLDDRCSVFHFWSPHSGGAHFLFADGSTQFLSYSANNALPALGTRAGGERLPDAN